MFKSNKHTGPGMGHLYGVADEAIIPYDNNGVIRLVIIDPGGDGNWQDNKFTMDLRTEQPGVSPSPGSHTVTVVDTDSAPTVKFSKTSVALTEETQTGTVNPVTITVDNEDGPAGLASLSNRIKFTTSPAGAVVTAGCVVMGDDDILNIKLDGYSKDGADTWMLNAGAANVGTVTIAIEACGDMSRFNDDMVTFSFDADSLKGVPVGYGDVAAGADLVVTVRSVGEDKPEVSFSTTSIDVNEGDTSTVAIIADGKLGPEVGSVTVSVSDDGAMLSLLQGMDMLDADEDGMYEVELGDSANTILTVMADDDPALDDGMTATATLTIESASGADIGARNSLAVTVSGVTQETDPDEGDEETDPDEGDEDPEPVPALPLIAQWLLGLGLMGGGVRQLFRRRRQG